MRTISEIVLIKARFYWRHFYWLRNDLCRNSGGHRDNDHSLFRKRLCLYQRDKQRVATSGCHATRAHGRHKICNCPFCVACDVFPREFGFCNVQRLVQHGSRHEPRGICIHANVGRRPNKHITVYRAAYHNRCSRLCRLSFSMSDCSRFWVF